MARLSVTRNCLAGGHWLTVPEPMARCQNARHSERYSVRTTLSDALNGLEQEYAWLQSEGI